MMATIITDEQKAALREAIESSLSKGIGLNAAKLPAPEVEPVNMFGVLEPDLNDAVNNTYIVIDPAPNANYLVSLYWNGDQSIQPVTSDGNSPLRVPVPAALVIAAANKTINVIYAVLDPNSPTAVPSEILRLAVDKYTAPVYPKPVITEAGNGELDVSKLTADPHLTLAAWPGQAIGQKIWLTLESTPPIGIINWDPLVVSKLGVQSRFLSLAKLKTLTDGSTLKLKLKASFNGETPFDFSETTYTIKQTPNVKAIAITSVKDAKGNDIPNGGTTTETSVTVSGTVTFA